VGPLRHKLRESPIMHPADASKHPKGSMLIIQGMQLWGTEVFPGFGVKSLVVLIYKYEFLLNYQGIKLKSTSYSVPIS